MALVAGPSSTSAASDTASIRGALSGLSALQVEMLSVNPSQAADLPQVAEKLQAAAGEAVAAVSNFNAGGAIDEAVSAVREKAASAAGALETGVKDIASNVSSSLNSLFGNTTDAKAADTKTPTPDALVASFKKALPKTGAFVMSSLTGQVDSVDFGGALTKSAQELSKMAPDALKAAADRLGEAVPKTDAELEKFKDAVMDTVKEVNFQKAIADLKEFNHGFAVPELKTFANQTSRGSGLGSLIGGIRSAVKDVGGAVSGITSGVGTVIKGIGDGAEKAAEAILGKKTLSSFSKTFKEVAPFVADVATKFVGVNNLAGVLPRYYTKGLPNLATVSGAALGGIPTGTNYTLFNRMQQLSQQFGAGHCYGGGSAVPYGYNQNLYNTLFGMAMDGGMSGLLGCLATSPYFNNTTRDLAGKLLTSQTRGGVGRPDVVDTVISLIGGQRIPNPTGVVQSLTRTKGMDAGGIATVVDIMGKLGVTGESLFGTGDKIGDSIVWNGPRVLASDPRLAQSTIGGVGKVARGKPLTTTLSNGEVITWNDRPTPKTTTLSDGNTITWM